MLKQELKFNDETRTFDYIIVGGGTAGCVLANRLSAENKWRVCLIEAGPPDTNPFIHIPMGIAAVLNSTVLNWHYATTPQQHCNNRHISISQGRTLGGTSSMNGMCYIRGIAEDFDKWAALGNTHWSYAHVLPYFKKLENFENGPNEYHEVGGPLNIAEHRFINPLMKAFLHSANQAGHPINKDFNSQHREGVGYYHVTQKQGQRCSNAHAYLHPIKTRKNLTIITNALVKKILFKNKQAVGVRYHKDNHDVDILVNNEIIISAGVFNSPRILLLSGIGPTTELQKHGIEQIHSLRGVGENLQDHLDIHITYAEKTKHGLSLHPYILPRHMMNVAKYFFLRKGELTSCISQAGGFIKSDASQPNPNLQLHFIPCFYPKDGKTPLLKNAYTLQVSFLQPFSRGRITLQDNNPFSKPCINPNYLADPRDLEALTIGLKHARKILAQPGFYPHGLNEVEPGQAIQNDAQIKEYIQNNAHSAYHFVGTCKMGQDNMAVVDSELKVHGTQGLRVIDASIMPVIIHGNTSATTTMIAEKGADLILKANV